MKHLSIMILLCCASTLAAETATPQETPTSAESVKPSKFASKMAIIADKMTQKVVESVDDSMKSRMHGKTGAMGMRNEVMELGRKYWGLLRTDPYMSEPVGETVSLEQQLTLLKKSLRYLKKEKALLDEKFEALKKSKGGGVGRMINLLEPSRIMCDRVIRDYSRQIKVLESVQKSTAKDGVEKSKKSVTPAVKGPKEKAAPSQ